MVFNSIQFAAFFLVFYAVYRLIPRRAQNWLLLAASAAFYAAWDWRFLGLIAAIAVVSYACGRAMSHAAGHRQRRLALAAGVGFGLAVLGFFKYVGFFAENLRALLALAGWQADWITLRVALPIGISFYTFVAIGYLVDVYRRTIEPARDPIDFAVFVTFFPTVLAGPILRASEMLPQLARPRRPGRAAMREGLWLILWGVTKKMFVADNLARVTNGVFAAGASPTGFEVLLGVYAFAFQIYGDFSGYTDIARGLAALMGFELPINFRFPYLVRTPQAFWQHWHITLSTWLRDYLFLPLSYAFSRRLDGVRWLGFRDDAWIYAAATIITMLVAGLWHGAAWTFVVWGAYQGVLLAVFRFAAMGRTRRRRRTVRGWRARFAGAAAVLGMFHLTCAGWLAFRAGSLGQAVDHAGSLLLRFRPSLAAWQEHGWALLFYAAPVLAVHGYEAWRSDLSAVMESPRVVRYVVCGALAYLVLLFGDFAGAQFIYFQF